MADNGNSRRSASADRHRAPASNREDPGREIARLVSAYRQGDYEEVINGANRFIRHWPEQVVGWNLLAEGCRMDGRLDEAEAACRRALALDPRNAEAHNNTGNLFRDRGDAATAEAAYGQALSIKPALVEARLNLARLLRGEGRSEEALSHCRKAVEQSPDHHAGRYLTGSILHEMGDHAGARSQFEKLVSACPDHADAHVELCRALVEIGEYEQARTACERAITLAPELARAHGFLGNVLRVMGDFPSAESSIRRALELRPDYVSGWYMLSNICRFEAHAPELSSMEELLERSSLDRGDRALLNFALGKAHADAGSDPDTVFRYYEAGCRLKRETLQYDVRDDEQFMESIASTFTPDWFARHRGAGDPDTAPIFIVGMPRSGTTLVEQILASHAAVHGAGESAELGNLVAAKSAASGDAYPVWAGGMPSDELSLLGAHYRDRVVGPAAPLERVVDKMPSNFLYLGLIAAAMPRARVVHMQRDPVDTCLSCYMHLFTRAQSFSYDLEELGAYYRSYSRLMAHWRNVLPSGFMLDFRYEDLVDDPEPRIRGLLAHCGLEWDPACLDFHANRRAVRTASATQVRQPLYRGSIGTWNRYRQHLEPLLAALGPGVLPAETGSR